MSARADLLTEYGRAEDAPLGTLTDFRLKLDAYRAEVLAEDGQAYDGELAMLRGLVRTLRVVVRDGTSDEKRRAEIERLLHQHAADDAVAREQGKSSHQADATPASAREARLNQLLDAIRTHGGKWSTRQVQEIRRLSNGPTQRGTARRDLAELARRGHLHQHGAGDGRYYTLLRKDGRS